MSRAPFQVLVFPFRRAAEAKVEHFEYAVFKRADAGYWQAIAGGGEDDEQPIAAARREAYEEAEILPASSYYPLDSVARIPTYFFDARSAWPKSTYVIPNHCFAVEVPNTGPGTDIVLSHEHSEYRWVSFPEGTELLYWEDNRTALWELNERLLNGDLPQPI